MKVPTLSPATDKLAPRASPGWLRRVDGRERVLGVGGLADGRRKWMGAVNTTGEIGNVLARFTAGKLHEISPRQTVNFEFSWRSPRLRAALRMTCSAAAQAPLRCGGNKGAQEVPYRVRAGGAGRAVPSRAGRSRREPLRLPARVGC
ncbi:hypothetical protein ACFFX0_25250 [Citricoccus parietis]|uniref:Uncharacterized protein n=1 Tax=Citricoccus parietis TaxID=592307 RepID=A0ABV5G5V0_9MICC